MNQIEMFILGMLCMGMLMLCETLSRTKQSFCSFSEVIDFFTRPFTQYRLYKQREKMISEYLDLHREEIIDEMMENVKRKVFGGGQITTEAVVAPMKPNEITFNEAVDGQKMWEKQIMSRFTKVE